MLHVFSTNRVKLSARKPTATDNLGPFGLPKNRLIRLVFSAGTVFFSHNNSAGTVFLSQFQQAERDARTRNSVGSTQ